MLGNFGAKQSKLLYFLTPSLSKNCFCTSEGTDIHRNNVLHYECYHFQTKLFSPSHPFQSSVNVRMICFEAGV